MQQLAFGQRDLLGDIAGHACRERTAVHLRLADDQLERERVAVAPPSDRPLVEVSDLQPAARPVGRGLELADRADREQRRHVAADDLRLVVAEHRFGGGVEGKDRPVLSDGDDPVDAVLDDQTGEHRAQ